MINVVVSAAQFYCKVFHIVMVNLLRLVAWGGFIHQLTGLHGIKLILNVFKMLQKELEVL